MKPGEKYEIFYSPHNIHNKTIKIKASVDEKMVVFSWPNWVPMNEVRYEIKDTDSFDYLIKQGHLKKLPGLSYEEYEALETNTSYQEDRKRDLEAFNEANGTDYKYYFEYVFERRFLGESCATIAAPFSLTRGAVREQIKKLDKLHSLS